MRIPGTAALVAALLVLSSSPATAVVPLDTQITSGPENGAVLLPGPVTYTFSSTGGVGVTYECSVDDAPFDTCNGGTSATYDLPPGGHLLKVRAVESMTPDPTPVERIWTIRNLPCEQAGAAGKQAQADFFAAHTKKGYTKEKLQRAKNAHNQKLIKKYKKKIKKLNKSIKNAQKRMDAAAAQEAAVC